jgi:hypothetical protein
MELTDLHFHGSDSRLDQEKNVSRYIGVKLSPLCLRSKGDMSHP